MIQHTYESSPVAALRDFLKLESASGILLVIAGVLAMIAANTPLSELYQAFLQTPIKLQVGAFKLDKTLLIWINDLLMAIFFLLVGLEIKREVVAGELSERSKVALPAIAALGGMIVPAAIYAWLNWNDPVGIRGWAIPSATDIAFALGVLSLFGNRVPVGLKVFLMTLAVLDDLGAIVIIALFYSSDLSVNALMRRRCRDRRAVRAQPRGRHAHCAVHPGRHRAVGIRAQVRRACDARGRRDGALRAGCRIPPIPTIRRHRGSSIRCIHGSRSASCRSSRLPMPA